MDKTPKRTNTQAPKTAKKPAVKVAEPKTQVIETPVKTVPKTAPRTAPKTASKTGAKTTASAKPKQVVSQPPKSDVKSKAAARLSKVPKIVTKDTNDFGSSGYADSFFDSVNIDKSVFYEDDAAAANNESHVTHSHTIDGSMLSSDSIEKAAKTKKKQKRNVSIDFSLAERYEPDCNVGLTHEQVESRVEKGFVNVTPTKAGKSYPSIFLTNIFTFFNILTYVVAIALIVVGAKFSQLFFLVIILANIAIGVFQECKSKRTVDKLRLMSAPTAIVVRDGEKKAIPVSEVVLDDIIYLETGKQICADAIVVKGEMEVNESMLTGESEPMKKAGGSELYSGSFVTSGSCYARVNKVGAANYVETLTSYAKRYRKPKSELNNSIKLIIKFVSVLIVPITIMMLYNNYKTLSGSGVIGWDLWRQNISSVSGAVIGMIPAGMFLLTSTALAVSVMRLAKKKTLVQDLYCIEMLARVDVLCLDKTGTITDGSMQVKKVIDIKGGNELPYSFNDIIGSVLTATEDNNQTAMALANYFGYSKALTPTAVMPFSSQRKLSAASFEGAGTFIFGAPEFVLRDVGVRIERIVAENAANGFRVLVLAHSPSDIVGDKLPAVRRPLCLIVIEDHIRDDAVETIRWFKENDVAVKVISGDNPITVSEVARRVGVDKAELYISLDGLSNQEVIEAAKKYTVFGRVSPEQKLLLVKTLKANGHTVAMTGDGVNDILAMREADCSVAIASGAEAARNVAHLVLLDSNFTSMPDVVREGRRVVNNIQKSSSLFLMKTFMSILLSIIFLIIPTMKGAIFTRYPFQTNNLLLLEMCIIGVPSFVLALQKNENIIKGNFLSNVIGRCVPGGLSLVVATMSVYYYNTYMIDSSGVVAGTSPLYTTMLVVALTFSGLMMLIKISEPFDLIRALLVIAVFALSLTGILIMPETTFGITKGVMNLQDTLFVITAVLGTYFFASLLMKILQIMKVLH